MHWKRHGSNFLQEIFSIDFFMDFIQLTFYSEPDYRVFVGFMLFPTRTQDYEYYTMFELDEIYA